MHITTSSNFLLFLPLSLSLSVSPLSAHERKREIEGGAAAASAILHIFLAAPWQFYTMRTEVFTILICTLLGAQLLQLPPRAFAQPSVTDLVYHVCNLATFAAGDSFSQNLDAVADLLKQNSSRVLYSLASSETGTESNYVHAMYQCRGDIVLSDCSTCVTNAFTEFRSTGTPSLCRSLVRGLRVQYLGCHLRYESYDFIRLETGLAQSPSCTGINESSQLYQQNLGTALQDSVTAASQHPLFGYNSTSVGVGSNTAYALTQCLGYLNLTQCATCLSQVSNYSDICNRSVSGQVYFIACYYLFGNTSLVFTYHNDPPLSVSPDISPPLSQAPATITSPLPEGGQPRARNYTAAIVGTGLGIFALLAFIAAALALCCLKRLQKKSGAEIQDAQGEQLVRTRRFSLKELEDATNNFHAANKLGQGGFGPVYQGRLKSGREVAIKMLSSQSRQGKSEFVNEVTLITTVQHRNLIQLLGCCEEDNKQLLVYEYLPNRSLDLCLFDVDKNIALDWRTRFDIIVGIAKGLRYLHEDSPVRIIHRDIKASNILLDNNLDPKIADFGLARLFGDDMSHLTTGVVGTLGYLAPEYAIGRQLSEKADVYSFGLVVLEIVSGRRVVETDREADKQNLLDWTWVLYEKHQQLQILDERIQKAEKGLDGNGSVHVNVGEVIRVVHVALLCTQLHAQARPSMSEVHNMLCGTSDILNIPTKPMNVGMLSPIADLLHDGSSTMFSSSSRPSQPSVQSTYSYDANPISQVEAR